MNNIIQAVRGMNDLLPDQIGNWQYLESVLNRLVASYGYQEIRLPLVENVMLFKRTIGEVTDIVEKEMYVFEDRNGDLLALRPEGTAGCVRALIEHGMLYNQQQKLWYQGSMFRHERPQKGRYRSFYQFGLEAYGIAQPEIEIEMIAILSRLFKELGLADKIVLHINSLGSQTARTLYKEKLVQYFQDHESELDIDSQRRLMKNPLRILDSKNPQMQHIISEAPQILDYLDDESAHHFKNLCAGLNHLKIPFVVNPRLVRGLDYYTKTVFEWITQDLGAQGTVCAGGRYDNLVEMLNGPPTPAVGLAIGLDRIVELLTQQNEGSLQQTNPHIYMILVGEEAVLAGISLAEELRTAFPLLRVMTNQSGGNFKTQFKRADKSKADFAIIIGENELKEQKFGIKYLREDNPQESLNKAELMNFFAQLVF